MIKEQEEAIEKLEYYLKNSAYKRENSDFFKNGGWEVVDLEIPKSIETVLSMLKERDEKIEKVLELLFQYGQIDGDHHKTWVIDQIVRILTGDKYKEWIKEYTYDKETGECYSWNKGIAP